MSENSNSSNGTSWTVLTPEVKEKESGVETMGPVREAVKTEEQYSKTAKPFSESHTDQLKPSSEASPRQPDTDSEPAFTHDSEKPQESQVTPSDAREGRSQLNAVHTSDSVHVEDISSGSPDSEERDTPTGHSDSPGSDTDSFSDSHAHISPTSATTPHPAPDWPKPDQETSDSKDALVTSGGDELRKRKITHLGSLDKAEAEEDDDEKEDGDFQLPQRDEERVFSLNKCIFAAVILLTLGTIFFSGVLMDPDGEAEVDIRELKDSSQKDGLNADVSRDTPVGLSPPEMLSKQVAEDQQILDLKGKLQQHYDELKAEQVLAEAGVQERVSREELEKDYQRIRGELDRLPALQKELELENERMKEESLQAQRELEHLRATVSQLTQSSGKVESHPSAAAQSPSAGERKATPLIETPDKNQHKGTKIEKQGQIKAEKEWKKNKGGKKEGAKEKKERVTEGYSTKQKDWKKEQKAEKHKEEKRDWKKAPKKQDAGKPWKESENKKEFKVWGERKEWKEDKKLKKVKSEIRGDKKNEKDSANRKVKEEWKRREEPIDWKSRKTADKEWKDKKKDQWRSEKEWKKKKSDKKHNEKKRKEAEDESGGKEQEGLQRRGKEGTFRDRGVKDERKNKQEPHQKNKWRPDPKQKPSSGAPDQAAFHHHDNRWTNQRAGKQQESCSGVEECAQAQGLRPVQLLDFQKLVQSYLRKLPDGEKEHSRIKELHSLIEQFFSNGVFNHQHMSFREFVEDVGDILEDLAEGDDSDTEDEDSEEDDDDDEDDDDEMEGFEWEAMEKFALKG